MLNCLILQYCFLLLELYFYRNIRFIFLITFIIIIHIIKLIFQKLIVLTQLFFKIINSPKQLPQKAPEPGKTTLTCLEDPPVELQHCPAVIIITLLLTLHDVTSLKHCTISSSLNVDIAGVWASAGKKQHNYFLCIIILNVTCLPVVGKRINNKKGTLLVILTRQQYPLVSSLLKTTVQLYSEYSVKNIFPNVLFISDSISETMITRKAKF